MLTGEAAMPDPLRHPEPHVLKELFRTYRRHPWVFLRPLGNWGDELIFAGGEKLAHESGLQWRNTDLPSLCRERLSHDTCIFLHGGGGFNRWCSGRAMENLRVALSQDVPLVVQGAISVEEDRDWIANQLSDIAGHVRCKEWKFLVRERFTADVLQAAAGQLGAEVLLDHDAALALRADDLLRIAGMRTMPVGDYDLTVAREDPEANPDGGTGEHAAARRGVCMDPAYVASTFAHWVKIHLFARSVISDRLHSAIVSMIAEKPVTLAAGSYHKNRSVWEHSLSAAGVSWADGISGRQHSIWRKLPSVLRNSHKVRLLLLRLHGVPAQ